MGRQILSTMLGIFAAGATLYLIDRALGANGRTFTDPIKQGFCAN